MEQNQNFDTLIGNDLVKTMCEMENQEDEEEGNDESEEETIAIIDDALIAIMIYEESVAVVEKKSSLLGFTSLPNDFENFSSYGSLTLAERVSCYQKRKKDLAQFNKIVKNDDEIIEKIYDKIINLINKK
ncbi:hypothetical protein PIROE2DRAFT_19348 [Piromyces sp. E2]|nr:hypothetical protein PIROE2DRAFT_19348 [Piromyces sp. E2]|eukprot:OUM56168.1 hypothetical protein PIROE2DRAFT_19348 [Piromyces sp. E2]